MSHGKKFKYCPFVLLLFGALLLGACASERAEPLSPEVMPSSTPSARTQEPSPALADVLSVNVAGDPQSYQFSVEIASADSGCQQYADWWEVITPEGQLLYRRVLGHSHVNEQPFVRSGGPVAIDAAVEVIVRAHMHPGGYGGKALQGSVQSGFAEVDLEPGFAGALESEPPLPSECAF